VARLFDFRKKAPDIEGGAGTNILTLDIEDWCQSSPHVVQAACRGKRLEIRPTEAAVVNTRCLLDILADYGISATCFVLGSLAESFPGLVREIQRAGHEIASHGHFHHPVYLLSRQEFREDVQRSRTVLEQITGESVTGYRAPYFSVTRRSGWALEVLAEIGMHYDASLYPVPSRYYRIAGRDDPEQVSRFPHTVFLAGRLLLELPATTLRAACQNFPAAGGAFLGFLPRFLFRLAIRRANAEGHPAVLYIHPHDLDAAMLQASEPAEALVSRLQSRTLAWRRGSIEGRLRALLSESQFTSIREWMGQGRDQDAFASARPAASSARQA